MIDFVLFSNSSDHTWSRQTVDAFCDDQKYEVECVDETPALIVVRLVSASTASEDVRYRLLELTDELSFLIRDEGGLDDFLEPELPYGKPSTRFRTESVCIESIEEAKTE